jgi:hypothetical protein
MKLKSLSLNPSATAAAAESPPPIRLKAPLFVLCFKILQIDFVPNW